MKELRKKTKLTIFLIFSVILTASLFLLNVRNYSREHGSIEQSLNIFELRKDPDTDFEDRKEDFEDRKEDFEDGDRDFDDRPDRMPPAGPIGRRMEPRDLKNAMIMDHEVYTVIIEEGKISEIFSHGFNSEDFDVQSIAQDIMKNVPRDSFHIGNLYAGGYSYKYRYMDSIVILNNDPTSKKLKGLLLETLIIFLIAEGVLYLLSCLITGWLVTPAEEAFSRQKEFIADASHELKTPLAVIMASSDEINENTDKDDPNRKYFDNIRYEADRMNRLITGLLNLSRLEDGNTKETHKDEDISRLIEKTCLAYEGVAFEQGVGIREDIEEGLRLKCSKDEIEKMISTILDNAVKHSYRDTEVRVSAKRVRNGIVIKVVNSGDPIKDEDKDKIFERFYRADKSRARNDNRYGLGLAIAKKIAENHNGTIKACSSEGDTTFEIMLKG